MIKTPWLVALLLFLACPQVLSAGDWPTYLQNNARGGSTTERLEMPLSPGWVFSSPAAPRRAWSGPEGRTIEGKELHDRVKFDDAFDVAVVGDRVYFGSSVDHQVRCLDAVTGRSVWTFFTGAPVRLAPTVDSGRVYVGADDGIAYCLDARDGRLLWKLRLGPADERMIARGEMISRWPVRTGILVDDGVAYFGAGVFPHENVYLCATDAVSGKLLWRNDGISHMDAGRNDLSPQGYLLAAAKAIYVPNARSRPKAVDRLTGKLAGAGSTSTKLANTIVAGTDALVIDGKLHTYSLGTQLAAVGDLSFAATGKQVLRIDRKAYAVANSKRRSLTAELKTLSGKLKNAGDKAKQIQARIAKIKQELNDLKDGGIDWKTDCPANDALIVAGKLVFAGEDGKVTAFDAENGQQVWAAAVDGVARGLAAASGKLFVSTTTGKIYCFSSGKAAEAAVVQKPVENPYPQDKWTEFYRQTAHQILEQTGVTRGYCLVVGGERGRLAFELARQSRLKIYAVEPDAKKVAAARQALSAAGLYGHRITFAQAPLAEVPYSNYFANLIVSDTLLLTGELPPSADRLARHLKPAGGVIALGRPAGLAPVSADALTAWFERTGLSSQAKTVLSGAWGTFTRGTLPGAGNWSHQYGEPGNTANSGDKIVKGGLGVLWYGDPGPGQMVNRHQGAVGPLVVDGRMFIQGDHSLMAYDAYNGLLLWEQENSKAIRTGVFQNNAPGNLAVAGNSLFHMVRRQVFEHDVASGKVKAVHSLPPTVDAKTLEWGYVASRDGVLIGTATIREVVARARRRRGKPGTDATDAIFAIDLKTGEHLWTYQGKSIAHHTIALGPQRVFFVDSTVTSQQRADILREDKAELKALTGEAAKRAEERMKKLDVRRTVALESRTGKQLWSKAVDVTDCSDVGIGGGRLTLIYQNDVLLLCGANANGHYWKQFVSGEFSRRRLVAIHAKDGYKLWSKDANYRHRPIIIGSRVVAEPWAFDLQSGEQQMRKHPLTGQKVPWSIMRPGHHCGMLTGCDNLLLFRSGFTGFYDLQADAGTRHFAGHRLGCWINAIPTNGLVVIPEASAGCVCMFSIASTIVLEPRTPRRAWTLYSGVGPTTPVRQMALNFGAPGDRRDASGTLWLGYPRAVPNTRLQTSLNLDFKVETAFASGGRFFSNDGDATERAPSQLRWVTSSGGRGLLRCAIPLLGEKDDPATYRLKLYFAAELGDRPGQRVFDVRVQGKPVLQQVDVTAQSAGRGFMSAEIDDIAVTGNLVIELQPAKAKPTSDQLPILSGIEVLLDDVPSSK